MTPHYEWQTSRSAASGRSNPATWALLLVAALLAACSTTGGTKDKPDWVDGPAAAYPAGQFLLGRGYAESVELAQERARADLAKTFEVSIAVEASDSQRAKSEGGEMRYEAASEQRIVTRTDQVISGLRIAELWKAPVTESGGSRQHALAVLPRLQAGMALRQEIAARDDAISRQIERARATTDPLDRAGLAGRALALARERAAFDKSLRVVDLGGRGVDTALSVARLQTDLAEQLKRVALVPSAATSGPFDDAGLLSLVKGAIAEAGFVAGETTEGASATYRVKVSANLTEEYLQGWHWVRGNLVLSVADTAGRVRGTLAWPIKASAQEQAAARSRSLLEIERLLKQELRGAVLGFAAL